MSLDHEAIRKAYPNVNLIDDEGSIILDSSGNKVEVEQSKINTARAELDAAYAALEYSRNRAKEYPSVVDQLDLIYHSGIDAWKAKIKETKDKYPKP